VAISAALQLEASQIVVLGFHHEIDIATAYLTSVQSDKERLSYFIAIY